MIQTEIRLTQFIQQYRMRNRTKRFERSRNAAATFLLSLISSRMFSVAYNKATIEEKLPRKLTDFAHLISDSTAPFSGDLCLVETSKRRPLKR